MSNDDALPMTRKTALITHPECLLHDPGPWHPESPRRLPAILEELDAWEAKLLLEWHRPELAPTAWIERVHDHAYRREVEERCLSGETALDEDTRVCPDSYHAARLAAGAALLGIDLLYRDNYERVFAAVRPPGHHACRAKAMGFCLFNNIAIAARYAQEVYGRQRIFILDWDVHHGNGTQEIFYDDHTVFFCSLHQSPLYPHTGHPQESGSGHGRGCTLNLPLPAGADGTRYDQVLRDQVEPALRAFRPDLLLLSAGFDAHRADPLAGMGLDEADFASMTRLVCGWANEFCDGRILSLLEGGYNLGALARSVKTHLEELAKT